MNTHINSSVNERRTGRSYLLLSFTQLPAQIVSSADAITNFITQLHPPPHEVTLFIDNSICDFIWFCLSESFAHIIPIGEEYVSAKSIRVYCSTVIVMRHWSQLCLFHCEVFGLFSQKYYILLAFARHFVNIYKQINFLFK